MKLFKSILFGIFIPFLVLGIMQIILNIQGFSFSEFFALLPLDKWLIVYAVFVILFTAIEYYALCKKEAKKEAEEEEEERKRELEDKMQRFLDKQLNEDNKN